MDFFVQTLPVGFQETICTSSASTANLNWLIELKYPSSLSRDELVSKKCKYMAMARKTDRH